MLSEFQYVGDLVMMSVIIEGLRNKFLKWKDVENLGDGHKGRFI